MCGISGIINKDGFDFHEIIAMTDIIHYRGPDDEGFMVVDDKDNVICCGGSETPYTIWGSNYLYSPTKRIEELSGTNVKLILGHRRLSILDLSPAGHQPMSYGDGRYWIILNGEIYNYKNIRNELQNIGYKFVSKTDTEVVLAAYAEWGTACLDRFAGMWAFAIYDYKLKEIFISRDRYGIKPLYYWFSPSGHFCFGSEIKQFSVCRKWEAKMNPQMVYDYLLYAFTDHTDETMFAGVYMLPSGCYFKSTLDQIKPDLSGRLLNKRWYFLQHRPFKDSFKEAADMFKNLFEISVKEHLNADVLVGTALSGGLDSSAIVCEVNRILRGNGKLDLQKTFSSCSIDQRFDERKWMDLVVDNTKVEAHFVYPSLKEAVELTPGLIWHQDEPYQSQSAFLAYNVFKLARANGVKVLLNGQGADEYLGGYGQFTAARYASMVRHLKLFYLLSDIKNLIKRDQFSFYAILKSIVYNLIPTNIISRITTIRTSSDHLKEIINYNKLQIKPNHPYERIPVKYKTVPEISEHLTFFSTLPKYLRWEDRNSMAHSIEARVPFLDHRLVEFAFNLPDDFLERDGITKRVMREAMKDLLPEKIKNRRDKMGFTTPEELWVRKENPKFFRQKIFDALSITEGIIKPESLTYFDKVVSGKIPFDNTYLRIILFSEWIKRFEINIG